VSGRAWIVAASLITGATPGLACKREQPEVQTQAQAALDPGALRASAVDGLEAAAKQARIASSLGLTAALEHDEIEVALERLLARLGADPQASAAADRLFAEVQEGPAMRAALADYARANPELELGELTEGFVGYIDERLTRPEIAATIESTLKAALRDAEPAVAKALIVDAGATERLAAAIVASLAEPQIHAELERRLGKDPAALQQRLERRLADAERVGELLVALGEAARSPAGLALLAEILDHEIMATQLAAALARTLADLSVRTRAEALFGLALAEELDLRGFERALGELLDEPVVAREAAGLLAALAREEFVRERVAALVGLLVDGPGFGDLLLAAV
jgi:hypothetical protein